MKYYTLTQWSFLLLTIACLFFILLGIKKALIILKDESGKKILANFILSVCIWIGVLSTMSISGFLSDFSTVPPRMFIVFVVPLLALILLLKYGKISRLLEVIPPQWLIHIQFFRFFVEILLWLLFLDNILPIQMTLEGRNWDIIAGITAPIIAIACFSGGRFNRKLAIAWNFLGLILLANIVIIAILSFPIPFRVFMNDPANTIVTEFPIVFLPGILVPIAYYMHILSLKQLLRK
ncbi:MAG: hypothetical protein AAFN93_06685 [Bacteroidota bacterium]